MALAREYTKEKFFSGTPVFPSPQKPTFDLICVNLLISVFIVANWCFSAGRIEVPLFPFQLWHLLTKQSLLLIFSILFFQKYNSSWQYSSR